MLYVHLQLIPVELLNFAAETAFLAFQHYIVMLGTIVLIASNLVPRMGGDHVGFIHHQNIFQLLTYWWTTEYLFIWIWYCYEQGDKARVIQTLLFMAGINTLIQTFIGTRLPTVMSASVAFTLPVLSIIKDLADETFADEHDVWSPKHRFIWNWNQKKKKIIAALFASCGKSQPASLFWFLLTFPWCCWLFSKSLDHIDMGGCRDLLTLWELFKDR